MGHMIHQPTYTQIHELQTSLSPKSLNPRIKTTTPKQKWKTNAEEGKEKHMKVWLELVQ